MSARSPRRRRTRRRARWCSSRRPVRASTPSRTSRRAAIASVSWWRRCGERGARTRQGAASPRGPKAGTAAARVLAAADGDSLPARLRRGDGVQRQLGALAPQHRRQRLLLPRAHPDLRRHRPGGDARSLGAGRSRGQAADAARSCSPLSSCSSRSCCPASARRSTGRSAGSEAGWCSSSPRSSPSSPWSSTARTCSRPSRSASGPSAASARTS